ncbi:Hypothetical predicted protein, partial [Paramuricea clavata]
MISTEVIEYEGEDNNLFLGHHKGSNEMITQILKETGNHKVVVVWKPQPLDRIVAEVEGTHAGIILMFSGPLRIMVHNPTIVHKGEQYLIEIVWVKRNIPSTFFSVVGKIISRVSDHLVIPLECKTDEDRAK